ncbi:nicotinamide mononucleotide transporter PnuC [Idiomarina sp. A28L]|uniref:nicotinamide riboside transporter PnuC n=1 Tax=Idiomarina sp. A28L TaxID=1036674 RepID=UPI0002138B98|nr:nicotinamide riboside transporter PnuC [Idiomarina sp. A28L]EGN75386.1 nicotinamide mononucleotide transporter PnuC [Idiomarina sp. A28L]
MDNLLELLALSSPAELVAVCLAIVYVVLAIKQSLWCWPAAAISASIYTVLFFTGRLYMESVLQIFYVIMAGYGYWSWVRSRENTKNTLRISQLRWQWHAYWALVLVAVSLMLGFALNRYTNADMAYIDTLTTVFSFFATFLVARKVLENWLYWVVIDVVYIGLFWVKGYHATALLFVVYVIMAAIGYWRWRQDFQASVNAET